MQPSDSFNLSLAKSREGVDEINKEFYGKFSYPWPPMVFESFIDSRFSVNTLNQDIGDWTNERIPEKPRIWVAGCGTNQAVITALRFPNSLVIGTDISTQSLEICKRSAEQIGVKNLELQEKSINEMKYEEEFDYIICTGVIHHNSHPEATLAELVGALKVNGILELMVYNYYHRILVVAYQQFIRKLCGNGSCLNLDKELNVTRKLIENFPSQGLMGSFLADFKDVHLAQIADALLQPVEQSYTVKSLGELASNCNLEYLSYCANQFDKQENNLNWNLKFNDESIAELYDEMADIDRWHVSNLLMLDQSPLLWFYFQRKDSDWERKTEKRVCEEFAQTKFKKNNTKNQVVPKKYGRQLHFIPRTVFLPKTGRTYR